MELLGKSGNRRWSRCLIQLAALFAQQAELEEEPAQTVEGEGVYDDEEGDEEVEEEEDEEDDGPEGDEEEDGPEGDEEDEDGEGEPSVRAPP